MGSNKGSPPPPSGAASPAGFAEVSGDAGASDGNGPAPEGVVPKPPEVAPFLNKVFDMVSDPATDKVISWAQGGGSLVIWDSHAFERDLLRRHFKHSNFTSFIRQLNTYGFRKVDPDRWEWANEGFVRGQKHLLKTIKRKKRSPQEARSELQQAPVKTPPGTENIEIGKYGGLVKEVETLKRDKALLMQQLVDLRHYQQTSNLEVQSLIQRLQVMEQNQQQMMALLAIVVQNPSFLNQLVQQQQRRSNWWNADGNKKRRFPALEHGSVTDKDISGRGAEIIQYQPSVPETSCQIIPDEAFCSSTTQPTAMPIDIQTTSNNMDIQRTSNNMDIQTTSNNMDIQATSNNMDIPMISGMDIQTTSGMDIPTISNNLNMLSSSGEFFDFSALQEWGDEDMQKLFDADGEPTLTPFENDGQVDPPLSVQDYYPQLEQDCQMETRHNCKSPQYADVLTEA